MNSPLPVLHLFDRYLPPTESWAYNLIRHTPDVDIHVAARYYLKTNFYDDRFSFVEHPFGEIAKFDHRLNKRRPSGFLTKAYLKIGQVFLGDLPQFLHSYIKQHQIKLIHCHFANTGWYFIRLKKELNLPFVVSFYGLDYEKIPFLHPQYKAHYQKLFQQADLFLCEGSQGQKILQEMACPENKIAIQPLGVLPHNIPYFKRSKKKRELNLLQLASFTEKKGHIYTVKAFAKALADCPNMQLTLVGDERDVGIRSAVQTYIEENQLTDKIKLLNFIDYQRLHEFMRPFQVFIHPSCYAKDRDCEGGAPIVLLDAQATGMPVISTRHCDIPGEVVDGFSGLLADEKDIMALATHIKTFYQMDQEEYQQFSQNAKQHVEEKFDIRKNAQILRKHYEKLLC